MGIDIKELFNNFCCSGCKNEFSEESIEVIHQDGELMTIHLTCQKCGKDFGLGYLNIRDGNEALEVQEGPEPITADEVLDAHRFIKELDKDWQNYLPKTE